jgi:uncharacterized membrane protein YbhN (UPF0104 family)
MTPRAKRVALAVLVTLVVVAVLAALLDLSAEAAAEGAASAAKRLSFGGVALAFALYAASYVGRGLRLSALLPGHTPLVPLVTISARHNLFNLILPLRSGEASLPLMLKAEVGRSLAEGAAALVVARVLDLASVAAWLLVGLSITGGDADATLTGRAVAILAALLVGLVALRPIAGALGRRLADSEGRVGSFVARSAGHLAAQSLGSLLAAAVASLVTWGLTYGACFALLHDMSGPGEPVPEALAAVDFSRSLVGSTVLHLAGILPINTVAGIGPWEAGWTAGYVLVGLERTAALASAVVSHAAILAFVSILGGLGWMFRGRPLAPPTTPTSTPEAGGPT